MGKCNAFTKKFRPCRGNAGPYRLCHIHDRWYIDNIWLSYVLAYVDPYSKFDYITRILNDPFAIYLPKGSISSLEMYFDILYETGPVLTRFKINLIYQIACRCKRISPSLAPILWKENINIHIPIVMGYYNSYFVTFNSSRFKCIILDVIEPFIYNEPFDSLLKIIEYMLINKFNINACTVIIDILFEKNWYIYMYYDNLSVALNAYNKYVENIKKTQLTYNDAEKQRSSSKEIFTYIESMIEHYKANYSEKYSCIFEDELFSIVYHPDNVKRLIAFET